MADKKISELNSLTGANAADGDLVAIVDVTATETKKITRSEFFTNVPSIDVTGNVGIGTSSPSVPLAVSRNLTGVIASFTNQTSADFQINLSSGVSLLTPSTGVLALGTSNTERMRIDSSGNLLVGKTSTAFGTAGIAFGQSGQIAAVRSGNAVADFNRLSTDGSIVNFYKDGTTVGSIGSRAGAVSYIALDPRTSGVNGAGLTGGSVSSTVGEILPTNGAGALDDGAINLGDASNRFKDLYLSGTVNAATLNVDGGTIKLDGNYPVGTSNVALGDAALNASITGGYSTAVGHQALTAITSGNGNVGIGFAAGDAITSGSANVAVGTQALSFNTTASNNTAVGYQAGYSNTTGTRMSALGYQALYANTEGNYNTAMGYAALDANTTASYNTAVGHFALSSLVGGGATLNTAIGSDAMANTTTGTNNVAVGSSALAANTTASNNTAVGYQAMYSNTTGAGTAVGYQTLYANTEGQANAAFGWSALGSNTTGSGNTAVGQALLGVYNGALFANTTGANNTAVGSGALIQNTTASEQHGSWISGWV
jgi:hypothetical protein